MSTNYNIFPDLTLGVPKSVYDSKGSKIVQIKSFSDIKYIIEQNKKSNPKQIKNNLPVLYPYYGVKGDLYKDDKDNVVSSGSNIFFIDIDVKEGCDFVLEHADELFARLPFVLFLQKSRRDKLHIVGIFSNCYPKIDKDDPAPTLAKTYDEFVYNYKIYATAVLKTINEISLEKRGTELNYLTLSVDGEKAFDLHSSKFHQALYLSHNPIIPHPFPCRSTLKKSDIDKLINYTKKELNIDLFPKTVERDSAEIITNADVTYTVSDNINRTDKARIDKHYIIRYGTNATISGHKLRWHIGLCLTRMFGWSKAKEMIEEGFANPKDIFGSYSLKDREKDTTAIEQLTSYKAVEAFLCGYFGIKKKFKTHKTEHTKTVNFVSDDIDNIIDIIHKENRMCLEAATGTGKTTFINNLCKRSVVNRFGQLELDFQKTLNYKLFIITPFNVTNKLYKEAELIDSTNRKPFTGEGNYVMVFDRAIKEDALPNLPKDYIIVVDESHVLFTAREYRKAATILYNYLKRIKNKVVCMTATPEGEVAGLGLKVYKYEKNRTNGINVEAIHTKEDVTSLMFVDVENELENKNYDKICIFDDKGADTMCGKLMDKCLLDIGYYRSRTKATDDFRELLTEEVLKQRVNIFTQIAFNGLNFNNTDSILVLMRCEKGQTLKSEIIQAVGRFRKSENVTLKLYIPERVRAEDRVEFEKTTVDVCVDNDITTEFVDYNTDLSDKEFYEGKLEVQRYRAKYGNIEYILSHLRSIGYFHVEEIHSDVKIEGKTQNEVKKTMSKLWKMDKKEGGVSVDYDNPGYYYYNGWETRTNRLMKQYPQLLDDNMVLKHVELNRLKGADRIVNCIEDYCVVASVDRKDFEEKLGSINKIIEAWDVEALGKATYVKYKDSEECEEVEKVEEDEENEEKGEWVKINAYKLDDLLDKITCIRNCVKKNEDCGCLLETDTDSLDSLKNLITIITPHLGIKNKIPYVLKQVDEYIQRVVRIKDYIELGRIKTIQERKMRYADNICNKIRKRKEDLIEFRGIFEANGGDINRYKQAVANYIEKEITEYEDEMFEFLSYGGKIGNKEGKSEGGKIGGKKSSPKKMIRLTLCIGKDIEGKRIFDPVLEFNSTQEADVYLKTKGFSAYQISKMKLDKTQYKPIVVKLALKGKEVKIFNTKEQADMYLKNVGYTEEEIDKIKQSKRQYCTVEKNYK